MSGFMFNFSRDEGDEEDEEDTFVTSTQSSRHHDPFYTKPPSSSFHFTASAVQVKAEEEEKTRPPVREENLVDMLSSLPSHLAYASTSIGNGNGSSTSMRLPRRALYDVRMQLMSEDDSSARQSESRLTGLSESDLERNIYEGGFKTWESSLDLSSHLLSYVHASTSATQLPEEVVELGCGTALPSLTLFRSVLERQKAVSFVLCDFNSAVLRLVTLPNLLLTWASVRRPSSFIDLDEHIDQGKQNATPNSGVTAAATAATEEGDVEISPDFIEAFAADLRELGISIRLISGPWGAELVDLICRTGGGMQSIESSSSGGRRKKRLILASETIYSPDTLSAFTDTLLSLLGPSHDGAAAGAAVGGGGRGDEEAPGDDDRMDIDGEEYNGKGQGDTEAIVAAKRIYFGVGGGVDDFEAMLRSRAVGSSLQIQRTTVVQQSGNAGGTGAAVISSGGGVERCLIHICIASSRR